MGTGPEVIKTCPAELSMKFFLLISVKSRKNGIQGLSEPEKC